MKTSKLVIIVLCLLQISNLKGQNNQLDITEFYKLTINTEYNYQYIEPDSLLENSKLSGYASSMWAFNMYLFENYSIESSKTELLDSLLMDTLSLRQMHKELLLRDSTFQKIFFKAFNKTIIPSIHVDSIQKIMARFFYLHRLPNRKIETHFCATINEVLKMEQTENSPYYNAFCFMVLRNQNPFDKLSLFITSTLPAETDDKLIEEAKRKNYDILSVNPLLRQMIIDEFESKKSYLNFTILY